MSEADPISLAVARRKTAETVRDLKGEIAALCKVERNIRCLADDLDRLGLGDRAAFAQDLARCARDVAAFLSDH